MFVLPMLENAKIMKKLNDKNIINLNYYLENTISVFSYKFIKFKNLKFFR